MADDDDAVDAEQRRAAVLRVVHAPAEPPERALREQVADTCRERARRAPRRSSVSTMSTRLSLDLQHDVAGEAVADDHVGHARVDVARLDVADEVHRRGLQQPVRLASQLVALRLFLADRQQADARRSHAERDLRVHRAHHRELQQVRGPALGVGASVEQHRRPCLVGIVVASAGRSTPGSRPSPVHAAITVAPVLPGGNRPCRALPPLLAPRRGSSARLASQRRAGDSAIATTSGASTMRKRQRRPPSAWRASSPA